MVHKAQFGVGKGKFLNCFHKPPLKYEVQHQSERHVQQFHVAQQLRLADRQDFRDGLQPNAKTAVDEQIEPQSLLEFEQKETKETKNSMTQNAACLVGKERQVRFSPFVTAWFKMGASLVTA
jgi:hypothetical protein